eukprot:2542960-Alexandrium_andersonii.AAC.1
MCEERRHAGVALADELAAPHEVAKIVEAGCAAEGAPESQWFMKAAGGDPRVGPRPHDAEGPGH